MALVPFTSVDEVLDALGSLEGMATDDVVAALPHLLQTAELLDATHPDDPELVVAGLVHDLASALEIGCPDHAAEGARIVAPLLGGRVAELVAGHTDAKRYLVRVDPAYTAGLSPNSTATLVRQGGAMTHSEANEFEARAEAGPLVALRRADDQAKDPDRPTRPIESWRAVLIRVAGAATPGRSCRIREAQPSDVADLRDVYRRSSLSNDGDRDQLLASPDSLVFDPAPVLEGRTRVAVVDGRIVGFATTSSATEVVELDDLFVDPDWMRRGVGRRLVRDVDEVTRARGATRVEVTANDHALAFYLETGFVAGPRVHTQFGVGTRMRLDLGP